MENLPAASAVLFPPPAVGQCGHHPPDRSPGAHACRRPPRRPPGPRPAAATGSPTISSTGWPSWASTAVRGPGRLLPRDARPRHPPPDGAVDRVHERAERRVCRRRVRADARHGRPVHDLRRRRAQRHQRDHRQLRRARAGGAYRRRTGARDTGPAPPDPPQPRRRRVRALHGDAHGDHLRPCRADAGQRRRGDRPGAQRGPGPPPARLPARARRRRAGPGDPGGPAAAAALRHHRPGGARRLRRGRAAAARPRRVGGRTSACSPGCWCTGSGRPRSCSGCWPPARSRTRRRRGPRAWSTRARPPSPGPTRARPAARRRPGAPSRTPPR